MKDELNKSGYQYLKEKVAALNREKVRLNVEIEELENTIQDLKERFLKLEDEHERETFERLIKKIRVMRDWEEPK